MPIIEYLKTQGYFNIRELPDGIIANTKLIYTTALCIDLTRHGYGDRYCFENPKLAEQACNAMTSIDDTVMEGYIASRPKMRG